MEIEKRNEIQAKWKNDEILVIIATIAFGMGVDKKDVRFVIHMSLPRSLDGYIQEGGRAGRDHELSHVIMFYDYSDRRTLDWFIKNNEYADLEREGENKNSLYTMLSFAEDPYECRRVMQINYLDQEFKREDCNQM
jgi:superfamily II DNA helicase RecQ